MSDLIIRDVVPEDIDAITAIYHDAVLHGTASFELDPPYQTEMLLRMRNIVDAGFPYIVGLSENGALLGYAYASSYRTRPAYRWSCENSVYVDKEARGLGVGKSLMQVIIARCDALGFRQMVSVIGGANHQASIRLHEALGFDHVGRLPATGFKHGKWLDSVLMQLTLGEGANSDPDPNTYPGTLYKPGR
ncbi:MAG: N-acetyltransferase family protein [Pseudomonadota bacterium]